jgi:DNA-binding NtrC family response regulator
MVETFLARILERAGHTVITAEDGEDAVRRFKENMDDISIVLIDIIMPKKNGGKTFEEIKQIRPEMRVIFISGYSADIIHKKFMNQKGVDFISKPFLKTDLLQKVRKVLDNG